MDKYVACTTKKQWEAVLKKLEEDGYKWIVGNSVLSGLDYFSSYKSESVIHAHPDTKKLEFGNKDFYRKSGIKTFISAHDFLKGAKTKPIVISRNGRVVTAEDKNTGKKGVATCSPSDEFDFKVGAKLALARLWGEEISENPSDDGDTYFTDEIKVGNRVKIRDWDDMKEEFGLDCCGHINAPLCFNSAMKKYCGKIALITHIDKDDDSFKISIDDRGWWFDKNMIVKPKKSEPKFKVGDFVRTRKDAVAGKKYENLTLLDSMITECEEVIRVEKRDYAPYVYQTKAGYTYTGSMLEKYEDDEIHEGDTVRITDTGKQYTTYNEWIKSNITDVDLICQFDYNRKASIDSEYVVVKIAEHGMHNKTLAYVKEKTDLWPRCYLIDVKGLEKVTK